MRDRVLSAYPAYALSKHIPYLLHRATSETYISENAASFFLQDFCLYLRIGVIEGYLLCTSRRHITMIACAKWPLNQDPHTTLKTLLQHYPILLTKFQGYISTPSHHDEGREWFVCDHQTKRVSLRLRTFRYQSSPSPVHHGLSLE